LGLFWEYCQSGSKVADAWKQACLSGINTPYAVVVRESNLNDYITLLGSGSQYITRDSTELANSTTFLYYSSDIGTVVYGPASSTSYSSTFNQYRRIKAEIDKRIEFTGIDEVDKLAIRGEADSLCLDIQKGVCGNFDFMRGSTFWLITLKKWEKLPTDKHVNEVSLDELKNRVVSEGLTIPSDYSLSAKNKMMARRFGQGKGSGEIWCEGEVFTFVREFNNKSIASDFCVVAVRNADIMLYHLRNHPLERIGTQSVKKILVNTKDGYIEQGKMSISLVYEVKGISFVPVWHVQYGNFLFKYDAITGETYNDR
jgi:hypothetical protein